MLKWIFVCIFLVGVATSASAQKRSLLQEDIAYVNALQYNSGAFTQATIAAAIADISSSYRTLFLPTGTWPITSNITVPANIHLYIPRGTFVTLGTGATLTIAGGEKSLTAYPGWYSGAGTLRLTVSTVEVDLKQDYGVKCDGSTNDAPALQAAFNAITSSYVVATFPAGTCLVSTTVNAHSNLTLQGRGAGVSIIKQPDATQMAATGLIAFPSGSSNITVRDLTFDGNKANQGTPSAHAMLLVFTTASDVHILNNEFKNGYGGPPPDAGAMLSVGGASVHFYVTNNHFHDTITLANYTSDCFYFSGFDVHTIGNTFENCSDTGSGVEATSTDASNPSDNITIVGNTYSGCAQSIGISSAVVNTYMNGVVIADNFIEGAVTASTGAIYFYPVANVDSFNRIKNVSITGNVVRGTTLGYGIFVFNGSGVVVSGNVVSLAGQIGANNSYTGIFIGKSDHVIVANNVTFNNGNQGINVQGSTYVLLQGNSVYANGLANASGFKFGVGLNNYALTSTPNAHISVIGNVITGHEYGLVASDTIGSGGLLILANDLDGNTAGPTSIAGGISPRFYGNITHADVGNPILQAEEQSMVVLPRVVFSQLGVGGTTGTLLICDDCNSGSYPCTSGGGGSLAYRHPAGSWACPKLN